MKTLSRFGYWLAVLAGVAAAFEFAGMFILVMLAGQIPANLPVPDYIEQWTVGILWAGAGTFIAVLVGLLLYGVGSDRLRLPRFMVHPVPSQSRWMWRRVGIWHGSKDGSPVLKCTASWRTIMAVYIRLWNGNLLVFQWRGFRRERRQ